MEPIQAHLPRLRSAYPAEGNQSMSSNNPFAPVRDYSDNAAPVRYPEPDVASLDKRFERYKIPHSPIKRLHTGMLWAEGPAWNAAGRFLVWSDIPSSVHFRRLDEDGHV